PLSRYTPRSTRRSVPTRRSSDLDVGGVAGELGRHPGDHAQLLGGQRAAVDAHAHHEVLVLELVGGELGRPRALDPLLALGVQAHPAESPGEVVGADGTEALTRVDVVDALLDVERIVLGLELLFVVECYLAVDLQLPLEL